MMTSSNGNIFRVTGHLCGEFTGPDEFPAQRPVTPSFDVFFDLGLNKRLSKQSWGWWFETVSRPLWRHSSVDTLCVSISATIMWHIYMMSRMTFVQHPMSSNDYKSLESYIHENWVIIGSLVVTCSAPSHYLNQCWITVNCTIETNFQLYLGYMENWEWETFGRCSNFGRGHFM